MPDEGELNASDTRQAKLRLDLPFHCMEMKLPAGESELWVFPAVLCRRPSLQRRHCGNMEEQTGNGQSTTPWITKCSKSEGPIVGSMRCAMFRNPPHSSLNNKGRLWIAFQDTRALASCVVPPASGAAQAPDKDPPSFLSLRKAGSLS